jgi:predicted transcriptional regulator
MNRCLFCGGDASTIDHFRYCDGRQGRAEALYGSQGDVPFEVGSDTSAAAATTLRDAELSRLEARVLAVVTKCPRTCDAIETLTGLPHQTVSARLRGLVLRNQIENSGEKARTRSGRWAVIWRVRD